MFWSKKVINCKFIILKCYESLFFSLKPENDTYKSLLFPLICIDPRHSVLLVQSWQCTPSTRLSVSQLPALKNKYYSVMFELTIYNEQNLQKLLSRVTVPNYDENMDEKNMTQKYSIKNLYISNKIFGRPSQTRKTSPFKKSNLYSCIISLAAWFCLRVMFNP